MGERRFKLWGWGYADQAADAATMSAAAKGIREMLGFGGDPAEPVPFEPDAVPRSQFKVPGGLAEVLSDDPEERVVRAMGKAYRDVVRGFYGRFPTPPDLVARPRSATDVEAVLAWAEDQRAAVVPFGGGTSVVGGVEARLGNGDYRGVICLDMRHMDRVLEVDPVSLAARIEAGATGPRLEQQLAAHGLTLRFYPQSFEYSTLGGWIATRAAGHFATGPVHIEDSVESLRALTPRGEWQSRRLPGSGAGPSPDRLLAGSEGTLGVITEAWVRVLPRPRHKESATVEFGDGFLAGAGAVRELVQSGLPLSNCRLVDPMEAQTTGAGDGSAALLLLGFESAELPMGGQLAAAIEIARGHGGVVSAERSDAGAASGQWRGAFMLAPYLRDTFVACGVLSETFETAITWDRFEAFHAEVSEAARRAVAEVCGVPADGAGSSRVSCRLTHAYRDGAAPYFTILAPAIRGGEVEQWDEIKAAVSEAIIAGGGSITHHHAVGRDHRPYYDAQRPDPFAAALRAAKRELDPAAILNPGVLIDPGRAAR